MGKKIESIDSYPSEGLPAWGVACRDGLCGTCLQIIDRCVLCLVLVCVIYIMRLSTSVDVLGMIVHALVSFIWCHLMVLSTPRRKKCPRLTPHLSIIDILPPPPN